MGEGLFTLDREGRITYINRVARGAARPPPGRAPGLRGRRDGPRRRPGRQRRRPSRAARSPARCAARSTVRVEDDIFATAGGGELPVAYTATPFSTEEGPQGCVVIFQDISERKRREEEQPAQRRDAGGHRPRRAGAPQRRLRAPLAADHRPRQRRDRPARAADAHGRTRRRVVAPGEFLPVCEQYAMIGEIDWWVIKQAARLAGDGYPVQAEHLRALGRRPRRARAHRTLHRAARGRARHARVRDHRDRDRRGRARRAHVRRAPARGSAARSRSTTSAPATRASPTSSRCRSTS